MSLVLKLCLAQKKCVKANDVIFLLKGLVNILSKQNDNFQIKKKYLCKSGSITPKIIDLFRKNPDLFMNNHHLKLYSVYYMK